MSSSLASVYQGLEVEVYVWGSSKPTEGLRLLGILIVQSSQKEKSSALSICLQRSDMRDGSQRIGGHAEMKCRGISVNQHVLLDLFYFLSLGCQCEGHSRSREPHMTSEAITYRHHDLAGASIYGDEP